MKLTTTIAWALCALALAVGGPAHAQKYPDRPIKLVTPYPAGGGSDITARLVADTLNRLYGWSVVVENRGGAAGSIGTGVVANSRPDGYTLLWTSVDNYALLPALRSDLPYKVEDLTFIARLAENGSTLAVNASEVPARTLAEFVTYLKANPGKVFYGNRRDRQRQPLHDGAVRAGSGRQDDPRRVPGRGPRNDGPAGGSRAGHRADADRGRALHAIGQAAAAGHYAIGTQPVVPRSADHRGAGLSRGDGQRLVRAERPQGLPDDIRKTLEKAMAGVVADPQVKAFMNERGLTPAPLYGDELRDAALKEYAQWQQIVRKNNIKAE